MTDGSSIRLNRKSEDNFRVKARAQAVACMCLTEIHMLSHLVVAVEPSRAPNGKSAQQIDACIGYEYQAGQHSQQIAQTKFTQNSTSKSGIDFQMLHSHANMAANKCNGVA